MGPQHLRGEGRTRSERLRRSSFPWSWDGWDASRHSPCPITERDRRVWSLAVMNGGLQVNLFGNPFTRGNAAGGAVIVFLVAAAYGHSVVWGLVFAAVPAGFAVFGRS